MEQGGIRDWDEIGIGNKPIDGGHYLFTEEEKEEFLAKEPKAAPYFRRWLGADEFLNGYHRYCLWLGDCPPSELRANAALANAEPSTRHGLAGLRARPVLSSKRGCSESAHGAGRNGTQERPRRILTLERENDQHPET
jgi:hypothetical protein